MAINIDLEKAYDRLEWHFLRDVLNLYRLPSCLIDLIMSCVSSSSILPSSMVVNWTPSGHRGVLGKATLYPHTYSLYV